MKVVNNDPEKATIEFTRREIGLLRSALTEFTQGPNSPDDEDWQMLMGVPRSEVIRLLDQLPQ